MDYHKPVLVKEVIDNLLFNNPILRGVSQIKMIDATLGNGGHAIGLLKNGVSVLGIDLDPEMLEIVQERLGGVGGKGGVGIKTILGNFKNISEIAREAGFSQVHGIIYDLGVTSLHLTDPKRGFSFADPEAKLDLRLNRGDQGNREGQGVTGADLLNILRPDQLTALFSEVLKYRDARDLADRIVRYRENKKFETVGDFLRCTGGLGKKSGLHQGTLPMLALRIAVNSELDNFRESFPQAVDLLMKGGRIAVITFHSGEEKAVNKMKEARVRLLTKGPILPTEEEIKTNPGARSAKLWVWEKI